MQVVLLHPHRKCHCVGIDVTVHVCVLMLLRLCGNVPEGFRWSVKFLLRMGVNRMALFWVYPGLAWVPVIEIHQMDTICHIPATDMLDVT